MKKLKWFQWVGLLYLCIGIGSGLAGVAILDFAPEQEALLFLLKKIFSFGVYVGIFFAPIYLILQLKSEAKPWPVELEQENRVARYSVCTTLGGGLYRYGVQDALSHAPLPHRFNMTLKDAEEYCSAMNTKRGWKLSRWEKFYHSEDEIRKIQEALLFEQEKRFA